MISGGNRGIVSAPPCSHSNSAGGVEYEHQVLFASRRLGRGFCFSHGRAESSPSTWHRKPWRYCLSPWHAPWQLPSSAFPLLWPRVLCRSACRELTHGVSQLREYPVVLLPLRPRRILPAVSHLLSDPVDSSASLSRHPQMPVIIRRQRFPCLDGELS